MRFAITFDPIPLVFPFSFCVTAPFLFRSTPHTSPVRPLPAHSRDPGAPPDPIERTDRHHPRWHLPMTWVTAEGENGEDLLNTTAVIQPMYGPVGSASGVGSRTSGAPMTTIMDAPQTTTSTSRPVVPSPTQQVLDDWTKDYPTLRRSSPSQAWRSGQHPDGSKHPSLHKGHPFES